MKMPLCRILYNYAISTDNMHCRFIVYRNQGLWKFRALAWSHEMKPFVRHTCRLEGRIPPNSLPTYACARI